MDLEGGELVLAEGVAPGPTPPPGSGLRTVYGVVKDSNGAPIAGANVRVSWDAGGARATGRRGEEALTTSDEDGFFKADVPRDAMVTITTGGAQGFAVGSTTSAPQDTGKKVSLFLARLPNVPAPGATAGRELARVAYQAFIVEAWRQAEQAARSAIERDRDNALAGAVLASCFAFYGVNDRDQAKLERAREWAQSVLDMDPRMGLAHNAMGLYLYGTGNRSGAETAFRTAVKLDARLDVAGANLGQIYLDSGRYADAERAYRQAIRARPESAVPYNGLAQVLIKRGRPRAAVQAALDAISRYPSQDAYLGRFYQNLAAALRDAGERPAAREADTRAAALGAGGGPY
jgi:Flp pilus assembly protein TadD